MSVTISAVMPIAIVAVAPIFPRVTMLNAIVFPNFILVAVLVAADALVALFADYIAIVRPHYIAILRPSLGASSLMLLPALVASRTLRLSLVLWLSRMLFAALIMTRLLLMMRIAMRFIRMPRLSLLLMRIVIAAIIFSGGTDRSREQCESEQTGY